MFINFSNHPSSMWGEKQKTEAEKYGLIEDLPFPAVSAHADRKAVQDLAEHYAAMILEKQPECHFFRQNRMRDVPGRILPQLSCDRKAEESRGTGCCCLQ